ncbi:hypothetical protein CLOM_g6877 [Closterium sp. NIES-68]|nr:hypothetical protein CLOM_g6877 [Closterium sp. NIES-68]GJP61480.1 hypothetical protein CLOP_g18635 [Closterium sp. NIES-67]
MEQKPAKLPLVDTSGSLNVERRGVPKLTAYWSDLFHTLINIPNVRFYPLLLLVYSLLFGGFALPYYYQSVQYNCIPGVKNYWHALWFSVQSAMTIGFGGDLIPDPDCFTLNLLIALQSLAALIVAYALLGIVYTRFALPSRRASSLVFSQYMVLNEEDGVPRLSFRVANVRKHQLIEAHAQLLVAINNIMSEENEALFKFSNLPILGGGFVFLALPCIITHAITKHSPLHGMSLAMMERADIEFLVLIEGVDAPTSAKLQARHSYSPRDIKFNHRFCTMVKRSPSGIRRVDFTKFHDMQPVPATLRRPHFLPHAPSWENLRNLSSLSSLPSVLRHPTAVSTDKSGAIMGRRDAPLPFPPPADSASASQVSLACPLSVAAAVGGDSPALGANDSIRKNSSFMSILSLGLGPGSGWGSGIWGGGVWGNSAAAAWAGTVAAGGRGVSAEGGSSIAGDAVPAGGGYVDRGTAGVGAQIGEARESNEADFARVGAGERGDAQGVRGGGMFLPLAGVEHDLSFASLPPVIEGDSGSSSPASGPPGVPGGLSSSGGGNAALGGTWPMQAAPGAAVSGAVLLAPVAATAAPATIRAGSTGSAFAAGAAAGTAAQAPTPEQKQMRRMVRRGSAERWEGKAAGVAVGQGRLSRRVSFEVSPVVDSVAEAGVHTRAEAAAGREGTSGGATAAVLDEGWAGRQEGCREVNQTGGGGEDQGMGYELPSKKGRREQRVSVGSGHGRAFSEAPIPVPRSRRNSASSNDSSMRGGLELGGRRRSGASKGQRSFAASGQPGGWADQSPLLLMNSFSVRSASHMLEMDARHRIAVAEKREQQWRALAVDLAKKVQSSRALHAPDVDCHPLLNRAKEFLET